MKRKFTFVTGHEDVPNLPTRFTYKLSDIKIVLVRLLYQFIMVMPD